MVGITISMQYIGYSADWILRMSVYAFNTPIWEYSKVLKLNFMSKKLLSNVNMVNGHKFAITQIIVS